VAKSALTVNALFQVAAGEVAFPVAFPAVVTTVIALPLVPAARTEAVPLPVTPVVPVTSQRSKSAAETTPKLVNKIAPPNWQNWREARNKQGGMMGFEIMVLREVKIGAFIG
jgi:hypothetical protein